MTDLHATQRQWDAFGETIALHQFPNRTDGMSRSSGIRPRSQTGGKLSAFIRARQWLRDTDPFSIAVWIYMAGIATGTALNQMGVIL